MITAHRAAARLQALWDATNPNDKRTIEKVIGEPKSNGAVGWTWAATAADGKWYDLGYTELDAVRAIRLWNSGTSIAVRNMNEAMDKLLKATRR